MSAPPEGPAGGAQDESLLETLESGWAPLPTRTLVALVMGGLRVRMARSLVTMISIVLAIAFLAYTGLTTRLYANVASRARELGDVEPVDAGELDRAATALGAADLIATLGGRELRALASDLGLAETAAREFELGGLAGPLGKARGDHATAADALAETERDSTAIAADLEAARGDERRAREALEKLEGERAKLEREIELARWLASGDEGPAEMRSRLRAELEGAKSALLVRARKPASVDAAGLERLDAFLAIAERAAGTREAAALVRAALVAERRRRAADDLATLLRRAGVSLGASPEGDPLDMWLIAMALLTCAVGIANAMLMSATERFREIGTMKCLGAQDGLVVRMFLLESAMLGAVGAVLGIALGCAVALFAGVVQFGGHGFVAFPLAGLAPVGGLSLACGLVLAVGGGVYPAIVAARMQPVDALRVDE